MGTVNLYTGAKIEFEAVGKNRYLVEIWLSPNDHPIPELMTPTQLKKTIQELLKPLKVKKMRR